jgi:hypothetical protein
MKFIPLLRVSLTAGALAMVLVLGLGMQRGGWHVPPYVFQQLALVNLVLTIWHIRALKKGD